MRLTPCMGGFCLSRQSCQHYHAKAFDEISERLCGKDEQPKMENSSEIPAEPEISGRNALWLDSWGLAHRVVDGRWIINVPRVA